MSCCMCELLETAQFLGDDTHAVVTRPVWASEHGLHPGELGVPSVVRLCRWVETAGPLIGDEIVSGGGAPVIENFQPRKQVLTCT